MRRTHAVPHHNTVFRQLSNRLPRADLRRSIERHRADKGTRSFGTEDLLSTLLLAQVSGASSLRDTAALVESQDARRYHSGLPKVARSTLADALARRPAAVFTDVLSKLIGTLMARPAARGRRLRAADRLHDPAAERVECGLGAFLRQAVWGQGPRRLRSRCGLPDYFGCPARVMTAGPSGRTPAAPMASATTTRLVCRDRHPAEKNHARCKRSRCEGQHNLLSDTTGLRSAFQ